MSGSIRQHRAVVLHDHVIPESPADEQDNLVQAGEVAAALRRLGFTAEMVPFSRDLHRCLSALRRARPDVVFNLVESLEGDGRLHYTAPALLDACDLPYTGAGTSGLLVSSDKRMTKRLLAAAGVPTPVIANNPAELAYWDEDQPGIVKPACEDASVGIDAQSVARGGKALAAELESRRRRFGGAWFVERYVDGREINLALLAGPAGIEVLPAAEIEFIDYPPGRPHIVDYEAKWVPGSHGYLNTPRRFLSSGTERALCDELARLALICHGVLDLGAYARIDFRVDADGQPWVLEANANPCLSSDAGFTAAAAEAGIPFDGVIERILRAGDMALPLTIDAHSPAAPRARSATAAACRPGARS